MVTVVVPADSEKVVVDFIYTELIPVLPDLAGWTVSTVIAPGVTPRNHIAIRVIGGTDEQFVACSRTCNASSGAPCSPRRYPCRTRQTQRRP